MGAARLQRSCALSRFKDILAMPMLLPGRLLRGLTCLC